METDKTCTFTERTGAAKVLTSNSPYQTGSGQGPGVAACPGLWSQRILCAGHKSRLCWAVSSRHRPGQWSTAAAYKWLMPSDQATLKMTLILSLFKAYLAAFFQTCNQSPCRCISVGRLGPNRQSVMMQRSFPSGTPYAFQSCWHPCIWSRNALSNWRLQFDLEQGAARFGLTGAGARHWHWQFICNIMHCSCSQSRWRQWQAVS